MRKLRPHRRLTLQRLESRRVLATVLWDGGAGDNDWHNPLNWADDTLPGEFDNVVIDIDTDVHLNQSAAVRSISLDRGALKVTDAQIDVSAGFDFHWRARGIELHAATLVGDWEVPSGYETDLHVTGASQITGNAIGVDELVIDHQPDQPASLLITGQLDAERISIRGQTSGSQTSLMVEGGIVEVDTISEAGSDHAATVEASIQSTYWLNIYGDLQIVGDLDSRGRISFEEPVSIVGDLTLQENSTIAPELLDAASPYQTWATIDVSGNAELRGRFALDDIPDEPYLNGEFTPLVTFGSISTDLDAVTVDSEDRYPIELELTDQAIGYRAPLAPDFTIVDVQAPSDVRIQDDVTIEYRAEINQHPRFAQSWRDYIYVSSDATYDSGDRLVAKSFVSLDREDPSTYEKTVTFTWPSSYDGDAYIIVRANVFQIHPESVEDTANNSFAVPITASSDVDLVVEEFQASPVVFRNVPHDLSWIVATHGADPVVATNFEVWLSREQTLDRHNSEELLYYGSLDAFPLDSNRIEYFATVEVDQYSGPAGDYYLILLANHDQADYEIDYTNNEVVLPVRIANQPRVELKHASAPPAAIPGQAVELTAVVENVSDHTSLWTTNVVAALVDADGEVVKSATIDFRQVPAHSDAIKTVGLQVPRGLIAGDYRWEFRIDDQVRFELPVEIPIDRQPFYAGVFDYRVAADPIASGVFELSFGVESNRDVALEHAVYFSQDPWYDRDDQRVSSFEVDYAIGQSHTSRQIVIEPGLPTSGFLLLVSDTRDFYGPDGDRGRVHDGAELVQRISNPEGGPESEGLLIASFEATRQGGQITGEITLVNRGSYVDDLGLYFFGTRNPNLYFQEESFGRLLGITQNPGTIVTHSFSFPDTSQFSDFFLYPVFWSPSLQATPGTPLARLFIPSPDLVAEAIEVPETLHPDSTISWTVHNASDLDSSAGRIDRLYFSTDNLLSDDDQWLGELLVDTDLGAGQEQTYSLALDQTLIDFTSGHILVNVGAETPDSQPANNSLASTQIEIATPRLVFVEPQDGFRVHVGDNYLPVVIRNDGLRASYAGRIKVYLSDVSNPDLDALEPLQVIRVTEPHIYPEVPAGETIEASIGVNVRLEHVGKRYLTLVTDDVEQRIATFELHSDVAQPAVELGNFVVPDVIDWSRPFDVSWTVTNVGDVPLTATRIDEFLVSTDGQEYRRMGIHQLNDRSLLPGESYTVERQFYPQTIPAVFDGRVYLLAQIESSRVGVDGVSTSIELTPQQYDVAFRSIDSIETYPVGGGVYSFEIENLSEFTLTSDTHTAQLAVTPKLASGASYEQQHVVVTIEMPGPLAPGERAIVDVGFPALDQREVNPNFSGYRLYDLTTVDSVDVSIELSPFARGRHETDRSNNALDYSLPPAGLDLPDLVVASYQLRPNQEDSEKTDLEWTIRNDGSATSQHRVRITTKLEGREAGSWLSQLDVDLDLGPGEEQIFRETLDQNLLGRVEGFINVARLSNDLELSTANNRLEVDAGFLYREPARPQLSRVRLLETGEVVLRVTNSGELPLTELSLEVLDSAGGQHTFEYDLTNSPIEAEQTRAFTLPIFDDVAAVASASGELSVEARILPATHFQSSNVIDPLAERIPAPDPLVFDSLSVPAVALREHQTTFSYSLTNNRSEAVTQWYLVVETSHGVDRYEITDQPMEAGETISGETEVVIPNVPGGYLPIKVSAQLLDEFGEPLEGSRELQKYSLVAPFDFLVTEIEAPSVISLQSRVDVSWEVHASGWQHQNQAGWRDALYYSEDAFLDASDTRLKSISHTTERFGAGSSYRNHVSVRLPFEARGQSGYLLAVTDVDQDRLDFDRENNVLAHAVATNSDEFFLDLLAFRDTGVRDDDNLTSDNNPSIEVYVPEAGVLSLDTNGDGAFDKVRTIDEPRIWPIYSLDNLPDGEHLVRAQLDTASGSRSEELRFIVDTEPPAWIAGTAPLQATRWSTVEFVFSEPVVLDPSEHPPRMNGGDTPISYRTEGNTVHIEILETVRSGDHQVVVNVIDLAGNETRAIADFDVVRVCPATNPNLNVDVNANGIASPLDALLVLNELARISSFTGDRLERPQAYLDVNCSGGVSALDALRIINHIAERSTAVEPEPESIAALQVIKTETRDVDDARPPEHIDLLASPIKSPVTPSVAPQHSGSSVESIAAARPGVQPERETNALSERPVDEWMTSLGQDQPGIDSDFRP